MTGGVETVARAFRRSEVVRFQHCDPAGIIFYPRYVEMVNATVEDWFAQGLGTSFAEIHVVQDTAIPAVALNLDFRFPGRLGEMLDFDLTAERLGRTSVTLAIRCTCGGDERFSATLTLVHISTVDYRPTPWPATLAGPIGRYLPVADRHD